MIKVHELRLGNYILQKQGNKIAMTQCAYEHFESIAKGEGATLYPVVLKPELLKKSGFVENEKYALLPDAHEFILVLPINGNATHELRVWMKNNGECFGRAMVNAVAASNNFYHLHHLQNLYFALTGNELEIKQ